MKKSKTPKSNAFKLITLQTLYALSTKTQIAAIVLALITGYALYYQLHTPILIWAGIVILLALIRLYLSYHFYKKPDALPYLSWYKYFFVFSLLTSLIEMKSDAKSKPNITQINSAISMLDNAYEDLAYIISNDTIEYKPQTIDIS